MRLEGFTTHINVRVPPELAEDVARLYCETFAPAMMLMLDRDPAPGLLVRPRPNGRIELGGWYVEPDRLPTVLAFAAGSVLACARALHGHQIVMPPRINGRVEPGVIRYGWYVDRRAYGCDLYEGQRAAMLPLFGGGKVAAQTQLQCAWLAVREALGDRSNHGDTRLAESVVTGHAPLPSEGRLEVSDDDRSVPAPWKSDAWKELQGPRRRPTCELAPVVVTWDVAVFVIVARYRRRQSFASIPRRNLEAFLECLEAGKLDEIMSIYQSRRPCGRRLDHHEQVHTPGLYDELGKRRGLVAPERDPQRASSEPVT